MVIEVGALIRVWRWWKRLLKARKISRWKDKCLDRAGNQWYFVNLVTGERIPATLGEVKNFLYSRTGVRRD